MADRRCVLCSRSLEVTERQTCAGCVAHLRVELEEIEQRYLTLAAEAEHHPADAIPGGPAMVAIAAGSSGAAQIRAWAAGRDASHVADEWARDGASVAFELSRWEDEIRRARRDPAAMVLPAESARRRDQQLRTLDAAVTYLTRQLDWAAQHLEVFDEFARDVRRLLGAVRGITRSGPQYDVPCTKCGVPLLLVDAPVDPKQPNGPKIGVYQCPRCKRRYNDAAYWVAVHQHYVEQVERQEAAGG